MTSQVPPEQSSEPKAAGREERIEALKLVGITTVWFLMTRYLVPLGDRFIPDDFKAKISLQTFRMLCQLVTLVAGFAMAFAILKRPRPALGFSAPRRWDFAAAALLAPTAFVASTYLALQIAMPTLLAELATRGPGASKQNAGELGRTLTQAPLLVVLLWGALLAAVGEELLFRGALWSALRDLVGFVLRGGAPQSVRSESAPPQSVSSQSARSGSAPPESVPAPSETDAEIAAFAQPGPLANATRDAIAGSLATIGSAVIFGQMHADMPGGVGMVRVASTTILGFVCGVGRQWSGTIWVPIFLHLVNNTLTIGTSRRWFSTAEEPILEGLPNSLVNAAFVGLVSAAVLFGVLRYRARRAAAPSLPFDP